MTLYRVLFFGWLLTTFLASPTKAIAANTFYLAQVPVASQSPEERAKAASQGLKEILWRTTGSKFTEQSPGLASLFSQAETYVDSFQFSTGADGRPQILLQFSPQAIVQLTQTYHLPYWPENRPKILVWLVAEDGASGQFIKDPNDPRRLALQEAARLRGLTLNWPNLDAEDAAALSPHQVIAGDSEALLNASFRYALDTQLTGVLTNSGGRWSFDHRGDKQQLASADPAQAINALADSLAKRYAVNSAQSSGGSAITAIIRVEINTFSAYHGLMDYLKKHALVASYQLLEAQPQHLLLELKLRGDLRQFDASLSLDRQLEPKAANTGDLGTQEQPVAYHWIAK